MAMENFVTDDLHNLSEDVVFEEIQRLIDEQQAGLPGSDIGLLDIAAIALNNMPPKYICSLVDKVQPRQELLDELKDLRRYARRQVLKAVRKVNRNPHD